MNIKKDTEVQVSGMPTEAQLEAINAQTKVKLGKEQVYVFSLRLCDDQVDRDFERFDTEALPVLAKLFIGKTGIADHKWSSEGQVARIFAAEVVKEAGCSYIKAWAYIRRGGQAEEIIADIEAGIKKEVSVGCAMGRCVCSVCGAEYGECGHQKGQHYDGQLCCGILKEPLDAYEFSFVAVPAQRDAGVIKGLHSTVTLKELADENGAQAEYRELYKLAQLGKEYRKVLQDDVVRLCLTLDLGVAEPVLRSVASKVSAGELGEMKKALQKKADDCMPLHTQLGSSAGRQETIESEYLI